MAYIQVNLGYGRKALIDADTSKRLMQDAFYDTEEMREDSPDVCIDTYSYKAVALAGSSTASAVWSVLRTTWGAKGTPTRFQFRENVAWDDRGNGWA